MKNNFLISEMWCTHCGKRGITIPRRNGKYREPGHLKKLFCIYCNAEYNHVEIRPFCSDYNKDDFTLEMKYHNFDNLGERKEPYRIFRGKLKQQQVIQQGQI